MFSQRLTAAEIMDGPEFDEADVRASFRFIERVNRLPVVGGIAVARRFLRRELKRAQAGRPLRVLDVGAGSGDIAIALSRRLNARCTRVEFACVEVNPDAAALARKAVRAAGVRAVRVVEEDIREHAPAAPYDCAMAAMFMHHFTNAEIAELIDRLSGFVRNSLLISDLHRGWINYAAAGLLTLREPETVRHDALVSVRRGFRRRELQRLPRALPGVSCRAHGILWSRAVAVYDFEAC